MLTPDQRLSTGHQVCGCLPYYTATLPRMAISRPVRVRGSFSRGITVLLTLGPAVRAWFDHEENGLARVPVTLLAGQANFEKPETGSIAPRPGRTKCRPFSLGLGGGLLIGLFDFLRGRERD